MQQGSDRKPERTPVNVIAKPARLRGRQFFANPGPTNIPESVLRAIDRCSIDFMDADFLSVYHPAREGLKRVLGTNSELFMYTTSGHGAWEASLVNLLSPGDTVLIPESGFFSDQWARMAEKLGLTLQKLDADWRRGVDPNAVEATLRADTERRIKAVCIVHNETSAGVTLPLPDIRAAIDAAGHPALYLTDTISSLACMPFEMDAWGIDCAVGGSQKGLMLPAGFAFTGASPKAMEAHRTARLPRFYLDWTIMLGRGIRSFVGTVPVNLFYGLQESIRLLEEEGLAEVYARHARLAEGVRRCVQTWAGANDGPQFFCTDPARRSNSITAVLMPDGHNAEAVRSIARDRFNVSLGGGLGKLDGRVFRIGHMGDLNEPMVLGTLAAVEMSLAMAGVPHQRGGVDAAMRHYAGG
jgi:alanine-glyoxylate transaminase/serine-glyoxylate transaminase/serine-pyruvate transaminase